MIYFSINAKIKIQEEFPNHIFQVKAEFWREVKLWMAFGVLFYVCLLHELRCLSFCFNLLADSKNKMKIRRHYLSPCSHFIKLRRYRAK